MQKLKHRTTRRSTQRVTLVRAERNISALSRRFYARVGMSTVALENAVDALVEDYTDRFSRRVFTRPELDKLLDKVLGVRS